MQIKLIFILRERLKTTGKWAIEDIIIARSQFKQKSYTNIINCLRKSQTFNSSHILSAEWTCIKDTLAGRDWHVHVSTPLIQFHYMITFISVWLKINPYLQDKNPLYNGESKPRYCTIPPSNCPGHTISSKESQPVENKCHCNMTHKPKYCCLIAGIIKYAHTILLAVCCSIETAKDKTKHWLKLNERSTCIHTVCIITISKIQLVVYYQFCVLIGWATSRLFVIAH